MRSAPSLLPLLAVAALSAGCVTAPVDPPPAPPVAPVAGLALERGQGHYEAGRYAQATMWLREALALGVAGRDAAQAHKLLAFMACIDGALAPCKAHFRSALEVDPGFALERAEAGHPMWGPAFREVRAAMHPAPAR